MTIVSAGIHQRRNQQVEIVPETGNSACPYLCPDLPDAQKEALHYLVKVPGDQLSGTGTDHGRTERHKIFKLWKCYDFDARKHSYNDEQESVSPHHG